ncbi:MAG: hypothetical protein V2A61_08430, partial [Calditrichota bacterium]
ISLLTMFGAVMLNRMVIDSNISAKKVLGTQAFYLADAGIQMGRRYLKFNSTATTIGPLSIGSGTLTIQVQLTQVAIGSFSDKTNVYRILSTATVGPTTRQIEEIRSRPNKVFVMWHENVADEY